MIATQQYLFKSIGKCITVRLLKSISNIPIDDDKSKHIQDTKNEKRSDKGANLSVKKSAFRNYDNYLPDQKGSIRVCIIGGSISAMYAAVLLKQSRLIKQINLIDTRGSLSGAVLDANHIDTTPRLKYFRRTFLKEALKEINIIALMDETNHQTKLSLTAQFKAASAYISEMAEQMVQISSESLVVVFARPVTAVLPMVSEIYKLGGWWDPDRIIGSIALDRMRMETITANVLNLNPAFLSIPMVGGADLSTIVPLLSCASPINRFTNTQQDVLLQSFRDAYLEMRSIQSNGPTLSDGAAAAKLILALARGLSGYKNIVSCAYVRSNVLPLCRYFTTELLFGPAGVQRNFGLPKMSQSEITLIDQAVPCICKYIEMGTKAVMKNRHITLKSV